MRITIAIKTRVEIEQELEKSLQEEKELNVLMNKAHRAVQRAISEKEHAAMAVSNNKKYQNELRAMLEEGGDEFQIRVREQDIIKKRFDQNANPSTPILCPLRHSNLHYNKG
jgi:hypothetical protein